MKHDNAYDIAIVGGGLAGLAASILLGRKGHRVILFEKECYPFHKVCGEYISLESWDFLLSLGLPLDSMHLPLIRQLKVTAPDGTLLQQPLPLGGFGISRYKLDYALSQIAASANVRVMQQCKVEEIRFDGQAFTIRSAAGQFNPRVAAGSFGKRSNLDIKWKRAFTQKKANRINNLVGIKYHVHAQLPDGEIALHNFKDGYCGVSAIEEGKYCLCYLTSAANLHDSHLSIEEMEKNILSENPELATLLQSVEKIFAQPISISQVSLDKKTLIEDHVLMMGDAAGMIAPLCGNGMSMALHSAKIAAGSIDAFLDGKMTRAEMERSYSRQWRKQFAARLRMGRIIQRFFGKIWVTNVFVRIMKSFPSLTRAIIRRTHGQPF